ncbi:helix-turn-helix DNA-binding domain protein [Gordonia phage Sahara]|uniref:Helix-turn-helix DNA binding domain protein n=2 Tax=Attisvirus TaxID=2169652 RepID=A0AAE8BHH8_9CAUD|nr:helix-turn-helix DNA-binding domain protein [Gordonia phage Sahara]YP_010653892.1 excise [Gordonia phage Ebert]AZS12777.1 excise [Gordonia phage Sproutie]AZS12851.1 excise [Gordonia phage Savage]QCW22513.1 excise [Gordonia phage Haley23]QGJ96654.1 excise [Gordonia phage Cynthia]QOC59154.1 excise [Gordonia phage GemG]QPL13596.1 excise [Gordonia phage Mocha12]QRI45364.1 excise [Gordonia Phage Whiteclaw]QWT30241.1 excise [Gordonia phage TuertoX]UAJ15623.1 excise [Gordonia phage Gizermo]U
MPEPERFMAASEVAEWLGIDRSAISRYKMPEPDALIGKTRGWRRETIEKWNASRPGRGARTDLLQD